MLDMKSLFAIAQASAEGILIIMGILSVISIAIMIERFISLKKLSAASNEISIKMKNTIANFNLSEVENLSSNTDSLEGRALGYGLRYAKENGPNGLDDIFNSYKTMEKPALEKNLNMLGTIASNAPYIGLLGTVMGIMKAFNDLANNPGQGNEVVMAGIAHALVSTAIGLAVAIPAVMAFNGFQKKVKLIVNNLDAARDLCMAYAKRKKGGTNG